MRQVSGAEDFRPACRDGNLREKRSGVNESISGSEVDDYKGISCGQAVARDRLYHFAETIKLRQGRV